LAGDDKADAKAEIKDDPNGKDDPNAGKAQGKQGSHWVGHGVMNPRLPGDRKAMPWSDIASHIIVPLWLFS